MPVASTVISTPTYTQDAPGDPSGIVHPNVPTSFFGLPTPVAQPSGSAQRLSLAGSPAGVVTGWSSYQTAFASAGVATIPTATAGLTIQQGTTTSARFLL